MATAKKSAIGNAAFASLQDIQHQLHGSVRNVQKEGGRLLKSVRKDVEGLLFRDSRRALEDLLAQIDEIRQDVQKRAAKAVRELEQRSTRLRKQVDEHARKRIDALVRSLSLASKSEVEGLKRRVAKLETRVKGVAPRRTARSSA